MTKIYSIAALSALIFFSYCKSTKTAAETKPSVMAVDEKQMGVVQLRWPNTPKDDIIQGQTIFTTKCTQCHANQVITELSEKKWLHEIDDMSPKANLSAEEKLKLTKFILSYREANTASK
jgi:mono/diheme cytochrome c family protein